MDFKLATPFMEAFEELNKLDESAPATEDPYGYGPYKALTDPKLEVGDYIKAKRYSSDEKWYPARVTKISPDFVEYTISGFGFTKNGTAVRSASAEQAFGNLRKKLLGEATDSLYVSEVVNEDTEPSAPFKAIYAGSKFVPDAVKSKLENEAFADYNSKREALKSDFEKVLLYTSKYTSNFDWDATTLATVIDGKYECSVYGEEEEDYYMSRESWDYRRSHIILHVGTILKVDGIRCTEIDNPHNYRIYPGNHKMLYKYDSASDYIRHNSDAQAVYDKAHEEAEAKLLAMAKKYFPDATLDEVPSNHRVVINLTKEYDMAEAAYIKAIREYEVSEEEIRAEDERIRNEIAASYGSGKYTGD